MTESKKTGEQVHEEMIDPGRRASLSENVRGARATQEEVTRNVVGRSDQANRLIAENATDMIWTIELEGSDGAVAASGFSDTRDLADELLARRTFTYVSPASLPLLGFSPEEMQGKTVKDLLTAVCYASARDELLDELAVEERVGPDPDRERVGDYQHVRADGSLSWCEVRGRLLRDDQGAIRGVLGVTRDISSRKAAEEALRDSAATLLNLFTHLPDFVLVVDRDARIRFVNRDAPGMPAEKLIGSIGFDYVLPRYHTRCAQALERAFTLQEVQQIQVRSRFNEWLDCRVVPMPSNGQPDSAMIICTDFTQQRRSERIAKLQLQLSARLSETSELEPALEACLDVVLTISETDCGGIYLVRETGEVDLVVHRGLSEFFTRAVAHYDTDSEPAEVVSGGVPIYVREGELPEGARIVCQQEGLRCFAFVPIRHEGRSIACINVASHDLAEIPNSVRGGLETTAALIGSSIARIQADRSWRESETRMRSLVENMPDVVLITELDGRIRYINRTHPVVDRNEILGTNGLQYFSEDQHGTIRTAYRLAAETREVQPYECVDKFGRRWACRAVPMLKDQQVRNLMVISTDITESRNAEQKLRRSESQFRAVFESTSDCILVWDRDYNYLFANQAAIDHVGTTRDQVIGKNIRDGLGHIPDFMQLWMSRVDQVFAGGQTLRVEDSMPVWGRAVHSESSLSPIRDADGNIFAVGVVYRDVTQRKQREQDLRQSEERLRLIAENVTDMVWTARIEGIPDLSAVVSIDSDAIDLMFDRWCFTFVSPSIEHILGYGVDEGLRLKPRQIMTPASFAESRKRFAAGLAGLLANTAAVDHRETLEMEHVMRDGRRRWCELTWTFFRDQAGKVAGVEGVTRDISQRKRFERELSELSTQQQQRTGQELHDGLAQQLVGARLIASGLQQTLAERSHPSAEPAAELVTVLSDAATSVRELIKGVRPVEVAANGLMAALADLASSTQRLSGVRCRFTCERPVEIENNHTATQMYYVAREAVHNATKHAEAGRICVELISDGKQLQLSVADDGKGITEQAGNATGMGLQIMRYRASVIGAGLVIETSEGSGTQVVCTLPLEQTP